MAEKVFVGKGWESKFGIRLALDSVKIAGLDVDKYGSIRLEVQKRREPDPKSKATHYVIVDSYAYDKGQPKHVDQDTEPIF